MAPKVDQVIATVLGVLVDDISDDKGPDDLPSWDSMGHFNLVTELETEYGVTFSDEDVVGMITVGHIKQCLRRHGVED